MEAMFSKEKESVIDAHQKALDEYELKISSVTQQYEEKLTVLKTQKDKFEESYNSSLVEIAELKRNAKRWKKIITCR